MFYSSITPTLPFLLLLTFSFSPTQGAAQSHSSPSLWQTVGGDLGASWRDAGTVFSAPARFTGGEWLATGGVVAGTIALMQLDQSARDVALRNQSPTGNSFADVGHEYGQAEIGGAIGAGVYLGGLIAGDSAVRITGRVVLESLLFSGAVTLFLKSALGRSRPYTGEGAFRFRGFQFSTEHTSMPSGHSTVAFAVSSALAARIHNVWATIGLYGLAALTAGSRVYNDMHWVSDTFIGAAIGTAMGNAVARLSEGGGGSQSLLITPMPGGIALSYSF